MTIPVLITGAGSVMGQSIYRALCQSRFARDMAIHFANSDAQGAGMYFPPSPIPVAARPIVPLAADSAYATFMRAYIREYGIRIVYAGTQHELARLAVLRDEGENVATLGAAISALCLDKARCMAVLAAGGVAVPMTQLLPDYLAAPRIAGAVIVKPNTSSASRGLLFCTGDDMAEHHARISAHLGASDAGSFVVQELLAGDEVTCGCYVDRYTGQAAVISLRRTLTADGASGSGEIVTSPTIEDYVRRIAVILRRYGLDFGHFNVQLKMTPQGPRVFEINGRLSSTEAPKAHFGFNSCAAFFANLVRQEPYAFDAIARQGRFIRYYEEVYPPVNNTETAR